MMNSAEQEGFSSLMPILFTNFVSKRHPNPKSAKAYAPSSPARSAEYLVLLPSTLLKILARNTPACHGC